MQLLDFVHKSVVAIVLATLSTASLGSCRQSPSLIRLCAKICSSFVSACWSEHAQCDWCRHYNGVRICEQEAGRPVERCQNTRLFGHAPAPCVSADSNNARTEHNATTHTLSRSLGKTISLPIVPMHNRYTVLANIVLTRNHIGIVLGSVVAASYVG